jgi:hypothetical protein
VSGSSRQQSGGRLRTVVLTSLLLGVFASAGLAQVGAPEAPDPWTTSGQPQPDTQYTPVAKDGCAVGWDQIAGAVFPGSRACAPYPGNPFPEGQPRRSATPVTVDFYTVSFASPDHGFAGGAQCQGEPTDEQRQDLDTFLDECTRVPVIWEYVSADGAEAAAWREAYRGDTPGFVGAIAWMDGDGRRAMAVGGTGTPSADCPVRRRAPEDPRRFGCGYPRREPATPLVDAGGSPNPDYEDPAGDARVWIYDKGAAGRFEDVEPLPEPMGALTAIDFSPRPEQDCGGSECGFAGGLGAIWMWKDGRFVTDAPGSYRYRDGTEHRDAMPSDGSGDRGANDTPYRVRAVKFRPPREGDLYPRARAVTSGCCDYGFRTALSFSSTESAFGRWSVPSNGSWGKPSSSGGLDSGYALSWGLADTAAAFPAQYWALNASVILSPGGPEPAPGAPSEPPSQVAAEGGRREQQYLPGTELRLVAGDGDLAGPRETFTQRHTTNLDSGGVVLYAVTRPRDPSRPDGVMDWAVGELPSTGQAIAYSTTEQYGPDGTDAVDLPDPLRCRPEGLTPELDVSQECELDQDRANGDETRSRYLFALPSYRLNGFTAVGTSGVFWAVGDRGALFSRGAGASAVRSEEPPALGPRGPAALPSRMPFDAFRPPVTREPGVVPPLATQPVQELAAPKLVAAGIPNPLAAADESVQAIAMSRDGSEGWAVGPRRVPGASGATTLYHYDGAGWSRCDPHGVAGVLPPDPGCARLEPVFDAGAEGLGVIAIARVPLELGDPERADEFEAVALAIPAAGGPLTVLRYSHGAWSIDADWASQLNDPALTGSSSRSLALNAKLQAISLVPSVNPPAPPPVNPAPPAGGAARKEAKQRQAAAAKSEEGEGVSSPAQENGGDPANAPHSPDLTAMTRRDRDRPAASFTPVARPAQPSAWVRGGLYGGGLGLAALAFAATWLTARPGRRAPRLPAPAESRVWRRGS